MLAKTIHPQDSGSMSPRYINRRFIKKGKPQKATYFLPLSNQEQANILAYSLLMYLQPTFDQTHPVQMGQLSLSKEANKGLVILNEQQPTARQEVLCALEIQTAAVDCTRVENNELPSPNLNSSMNMVRMGQNVSLSCSTKNTSVDITYSLFWGTKYLESKRRRGGAVDFHLRISNVNESGPYKCKINVSNLMKYSQDFNFTMAKDESCPSCRLSLLLPGLLLGLLVIVLVLAYLIHLKYKKGKKTLREDQSKGSGDAPAQDELYVSVCKTQTEQPQEIHYATPVFKEMAPMEEEGGTDGKADYIYSELTH